MGAVLAFEQEPDSELSTDLFAEFWLMYPRHIAKVKARRAWLRLNRAEKLAALSALVNWRKVWLLRDEMEYTPYPATWLNGERWEDELPTEYIARHASHVQAPAAEPYKRGEIPAHVLAQLAKLKAGK